MNDERIEGMTDKQYLANLESIIAYVEASESKEQILEYLKRVKEAAQKK